jgi:polyhydroxyalkanoate synthesis repressor PhaR
MTQPDPIIIKKYANRRLYNTATSSYVTLDSVATLVREGVDFTVEDARTGEDITRQILTQIIVESEASGAGLLPVGFLREMIRQYGGAAGGVLPDYLDLSMKTFTDAQEHWAGLLSGAGNPVHAGQLFQQTMETNLAMMGEAAKALQGMMPTVPGMEALWPKPAAAAPEPASARDGELDALKAQMAAMQEQLAKLAARS